MGRVRFAVVLLVLIAGCGEEPTQAHHMKGDFHLSGAGLKAPDWFAIPLCPRHHTWVHENRDDWRAKQRRWLISTMVLAFKAGMLGRPSQETLK